MSDKPTGAADIGQPAVHERDVLLDVAGPELWKLVEDWRARHQLRDGEFHLVLSLLLAQYAKFAALNERKRIQETGK